PLHLAAERGHHDVVKMLLESGADPSLQDNNGATPSHLAAAEGFIGIIELLSKRESQYTNRVRIYYDPIPSPHPFELNLARMSIKDDDSSKKD
ncbi:ankyrin repeat domain-containing protein, partial [Shewanella sp. A25]|nr:ankyrin repeat domain-containing protein [Shewanella shenzhenensis]